ncbi:uncharacterized protein LOC143433459 [Xylocopa sonorina]|uniref:uncharacterized protein LOC143433459 n=1 Tax=Xylocopa sonorina TaxID=1818115 RepID=UPI00403AB4B7
MVHSSNPRLMNRVLDAVAHLCDGKGSTARDVLDFLRRSSKSSPRNLTMQVHRALKHAVNAGLLRHRSGRYKALFTLNPAPVKQCTSEDNDEKPVGDTDVFDEQQESQMIDETTDNEENRRQRRERKRKRSRSHSRRRRRRRRSGSRKRDDEPRKSKHKENGETSKSPRRNISNCMLGTDVASSSSKRKRSRAKSRDRIYDSDLSDCSDCAARKPKARRRSPACQECNRDGIAKENRRSASRNRSPQKQQPQQLCLKHSHGDDKTSKQNANEGRSDEADQEVEKDHVPDNSGSGSTL